MKMVFFTLFLGFGRSLQDLLEKENEELGKVNENLRKKLFELAQTFEIQIQEDYFYNKQKIKSLVFEYEKEQDELVRIFLAEEMLEYLQGLLEDSNLLGGQVEGVSSKELLKILQDLMKSVKKSKDLVLAKENSVFFNQLHFVLIQKEEFVQEIQMENAKIYGQIEKKQAEIMEIQKKIEKSSLRFAEIQEVLISTKDLHTSMTKELEKSFSTQSVVKPSDLRNEDSQILSLQNSNNENSLVIEKYLTETSVLTSTLRVLTERNLMLEQELQQKSESFLMNNDKFSNFAGSVRTETASQALSVEKSSDQLQSERKDLEEKSKLLMIQIDKCEAEVGTGKSVIGTRDLVIEENKIELSQTENRKKAAIEQRDKEIQNYSLQHLEMMNRVVVYQKQLDETMQKVSEKATEIQELKMKLKDNTKTAQKH